MKTELIEKAEDIWRRHSSLMRKIESHKQTALRLASRLATLHVENAETMRLILESQPAMEVGERLPKVKISDLMVKPGDLEKVFKQYRIPFGL